MSSINWVSVVIYGAFFIPLFNGALSNMSENRIRKSLWSVFDNIEIMLGLLLSVFLTKKIFFENDGNVYKKIFDIIPDGFKALVSGNILLTYLLFVPIVLLVVLMIIRLITAPILNYFIIPFSGSIYNFINKSGQITRRIGGAVWQLPRSIFFVFIVSLFINFAGYFYQNPSFSDWVNKSVVYKYVNELAIQPVLNSNITKKIPVLLRNTFRPADIEQITDLTKGNVKVIEYFNGVTLDEAIKSNSEIDRTAREIVGRETNTRKKALLLYNWVSKNIKYDYEKAERVSIDTRGVSSGSIVAFETRKGICFDFSSLYISMCRAVDLKVRLITGLGYSGISWGDHAWNQVYSVEEERWLNVDTTFGSVSNYFDKPDFAADHKFDEIQGEW